jgi:hypothetical protein
VLSSDADFPAAVTKPSVVVKHDTQTGRWVTVFRAQWSANPDVLPHFTVGNMKHSVDIYTGKVRLQFIATFEADR